MRVISGRLYEKHADNFRALVADVTSSKKGGLQNWVSKYIRIHGQPVKDRAHNASFKNSGIFPPTVRYAQLYKASSPTHLFLIAHISQMEQRVEVEVCFTKDSFHFLKINRF